MMHQMKRDKTFFQRNTAQLAFTQAGKYEFLQQQERINRRANQAFCSVCLWEEVKKSFEWLRKERRKHGGGEEGEKDVIFYSWLFSIKVLRITRAGHSH